MTLSPDTYVVLVNIQYYVFLFSNTASRVRVEITGLQVESQVRAKVGDDSNTGASL